MIKEAQAYLRQRFPDFDPTEFFTADEFENHDIAQTVLACKARAEVCERCDGKSCEFSRMFKEVYPIIDATRDRHGEAHLRISLGFVREKSCRYNPFSGEFGSLFRESGLVPWQVEKTFETFTEEVGDSVLDALICARRAATEQKNLILFGKHGTGKTHLAIAIAIYAMKHGRQAKFFNVDELIEGLRHDDLLMKTAKEVPCLVLDDWRDERCLGQLIDSRYRHQRQTVVTVNAEKATSSILPKLLENGFAVCLDGENFWLRGHNLG